MLNTGEYPSITCTKLFSDLFDHERNFVFAFFVCLLGVSRPTREFFTHMETTPLPVQILTYPRHSWPLSSEGSLRFLLTQKTEF